MANELKHGSVGTELTQAEWEGIGTHVFESQAEGDMVYASSSSQLRRLEKGTDSHVLILSSGVPAWSASTGITSVGTLTDLTVSGTSTTIGTVTSGVWQGTDVGVAYGGTGVSTLASNSVLTGNGASAITAEANLTFDGTDLILGTGTPISVGGMTDGNSSEIPELQISKANTISNMVLATHRGQNTYSSTFAFLRTGNNAIGTFTVVPAGAPLGNIVWAASDGNDYSAVAARIFVETDTGTFGANSIPGKISLMTTSDGDTVSVTRMQIRATGEIDFRSNPLGITNVGASGNDWTQHQLLLEGAYSGGIQLLRVRNTTSDNVDSHAELHIASEGAGGGDPFIHFRIGGVQSLSMGLDNSDTTGPDRFVWSAQPDGIGTNDRMRLDPDSGVLSVDGDGGGSDDPVSLFDSYDDAVELERYAHATLDLPDVTPEQRIANRERLVEMGVAEWAVQDEGPDHLMIKMQPMTKLLAGGIYQTRHRMDAQHQTIDERLKRIEQALGV